MSVGRNLDVEPGHGARVAKDSPADFTWQDVNEGGAQFTRNPAARTGWTYHAVQRRQKPAHRAPVFPFRRSVSPFDRVPAEECECDVDYLCDAHSALLDQEAEYWAPKLAARIRDPHCEECEKTAPYVNRDGLCDDCAIDVTASDEDQLEALQ